LETEVNRLITYDRQMAKTDRKTVTEADRRLCSLLK
jgi:hypothetical protein